MRVRIGIITIVSALLAISLMPVARGDDSAGAQPAVSEGSKSPALTSSLTLGMDSYSGTTDMPGSRRISDGMWAGSSACYPSLTYLQFRGAKGDTVKVSMGLGDLYTAADTALHQPVEAYWQRPVGNGVVTVGKFWVPLGQQEWLYEAKPGVSMQWAGERSSLIASVNLSTQQHRPLMFARGSHKIGSDAEIGVSFALGSGFCSDTVHDRGMSLDSNVGYRGLRFYGEYNHFGASTVGNAFRFLSGKLYYENLGAWKPFVAQYWWHDGSESFGNFRSRICGVDYQVTGSLSLEAALAGTSDGNTTWVQMHWAWEKPFSALGL